MRVFFFITKSEQGGAQTHVAQLTHCLVSKGDDVAIMSTPGGWLEGEATRLGATFYPNASLGNTANPFRLWHASRTLLRAITHFHPDLVACHSTIAGLLGRCVLRNRIPTVFTAHGWSFTQGATFYRRLVLPWLEKIAALFCTKIICVSHNDLRLAIAYGIAPEQKLVVIHNGVENSGSFAGAQDDETRLLFIGRLASPKDPCLLLRVLPEHTHLTIIGNGPDKPQLMTEIHRLDLKQRVTLTGALSREETLKHLKRADVFVLPTRYEGLPYTVLEAMACGVPVVASDVGGVKEAVGDDAGIVVPPNDPPALKQALEKLINDPELRQAMGKAGFQKIQTSFSLTTMCEKTLAVYSAIMDSYEPHGGDHTHH